PNRPLAQLKGTWEIDQEAIKQWNERLNELECFEANGGHLHKRLGKGFTEFSCDSKHDDLTAILEQFGNWIQLVAKSGNELQKQQLIWSLLPAIESIKPYLPQDLIHSRIDTFKKPILPTLLIIQIAFKLAKIDLSIKAKAAILKEKE
ncbi:7834_t:CDS:2, partial [Ambispora leptoticha]